MSDAGDGMREIRMTAPRGVLMARRTPPDWVAQDVLPSPPTVRLRRAATPAGVASGPVNPAYAAQALSSEVAGAVLGTDVVLDLPPVVGLVDVAGGVVVVVGGALVLGGGLIAACTTWRMYW